MTDERRDVEYALEVLASGEPGYISLDQAKKILTKYINNSEVYKKAFDILLVKYNQELRPLDNRDNIKTEILEQAKNLV